MRQKSIAAVVAVVSCTTMLLATTASADGGSSDPPPTLADVLLADGDRFDFRPFDYDIVTEAVLLFPELVAAASDPMPS